MAKLSIDKNLNPGDVVDFEMDINIFGESLSQQFNFTTPKAPPLISKVKNINTKIENRDRYVTGNNKNFGFSKYKRKPDISDNRYELLVILNADKVPGDLAADDDVLINCSEAGLNNVPAIVLGRNNKRKNYLYLSVSKNNLPSSNLDLSTTGTITEIKKKIKIRDVTVTLPEKFIDSLISEKPTTPPKNGNVEDIVIFAYKQFNGPNKSSIKYKLMINDNEINSKRPPQRSDIVEYRGKRSYTKNFTLNDNSGQRIICYVAIARYIYNGENWNGEWLQTDRSDNVIWGKAG